MTLPAIKPDLEVADEFFEFIATKEDLNWRTFDDSETGSVGPRKFFGQLEDVKERLSHENSNGAGIFWLVNICGKGQTDSEVTGVRSLFLDLDGAPLDPVLRTQAVPHVILETSPGKHHCYWLITSGFPVTSFTRFQKSIARRFNGDALVCNPSRVMRVPGFYHMKDPSNPFMSRIISKVEMMPYDPKDLVKALDLELEPIESGRHLKVVTANNQAIKEIIPTGQRDVTLHKMGAVFRNTGAGYAEMLNFLNFRNTWCEIPLPQWQIEKLARQVCKLDSYIGNELQSGKDSGNNDGFGTSEVAPIDHKEPESKPAKKRKALGFIKTANELETKEIEPLRWTVPDILPQGLIILAGAPKSGKSLLIQQISYAVAMGGPVMGKFPSIQGSVLHLALEDSEARFKQRMEAQKKLLHDTEAPVALQYATEWSYYPEAVEDIRAWCEETPDARLIVIDTLGKLFNKEEKTSGNVYRSEYREMTTFHKIAREFKISVVLITHLNKASSGNNRTDPMMKITGSAGTSGAADLCWTFERRSRNAMEAKIQSMGKDLPDAIYRLIYDAEHMSWICEDFGCEDNNNMIKRQVVAYFEKLGAGEASVAEVADALGKHRQHVSSAMKTLEADGFLTRRTATGTRTLMYKVNQELFTM